MCVNLARWFIFLGVTVLGRLVDGLLDWLVGGRLTVFAGSWVELKKRGTAIGGLVGKHDSRLVVLYSLPGVILWLAAFVKAHERHVSMFFRLKV